MTTSDQLNATKSTEAGSDMTAEALPPSPGVKIYCGNSTSGELSENAERAIARIVGAQGSHEGISEAGKIRLWNALHTANRIAVVFDSYSSYQARGSHLQALEKIKTRAGELIDLLESQPVNLRPGISIEPRHPAYETYIRTLQDLRDTAATTIDHERIVAGFEPHFTFNDWFVRHLLQPVYVDIFDRPAKFTILADGRPGPFIRFVQQAYRELKRPPLSAEGAQTLFKRARKKDPHNIP